MLQLLEKKTKVRLSGGFRFLRSQLIMREYDFKLKVLAFCYIFLGYHMEYKDSMLQHLLQTFILFYF